MTLQGCDRRENLGESWEESTPGPTPCLHTNPRRKMVRLGKHTLDSGLKVSQEQHGLLRVGAISVGKVTEGLVQHPLESSMEALTRHCFSK